MICVFQIRASKGEDEVDELMTKARQLETELDLTTEKLAIATLQLEEKEKLLADTELEMNALNRRVSGLEEALEITETKMVQAVSKLDKAATASDDSERAKKVFQCKAEEDDKRIAGLEKELKEARDKAEAADATYDDASKKLAQCEADLDKAEERADVGETKIIELEEELRVVANNLKSLEVENFLQRRICDSKATFLFLSGCWGEGEPEGEDVQGADQDPECQAEAGRGQGWVCWQVCPETAEGGA